MPAPRLRTRSMAGRWSSSFAAVEGSNAAKVRQTNVASNVSAEQAFSFTLDTTAPAPAILKIVQTATGSVFADTSEAFSTIKVSEDGKLIRAVFALVWKRVTAM